MKKVAALMLMFTTFVLCSLTVTPAYASDVGKQCVSLTVSNIEKAITAPAVAEKQTVIVQASALQSDVGLKADVLQISPDQMVQASPPFKWQTDNTISEIYKKDSYRRYAATLPFNTSTMARWKDIHRRLC